MKHINIIDPGLVNITGHHYDLDMRICGELKKMGYVINIYSSIKSSQKVIDDFAEYGIINPILRAGPYINVDKIDVLAGGFIAFSEHSKILAIDFQKINTEGDWLFPSIFAAQLNACSLAKIQKKIIGCIHVPAERQYAQDDIYWRYSILGVKRHCKNVRIGVIEPELVYEYQNIARHEIDVEVFPVPYQSSIQSTEKKLINNVGFFGHQRGEKGLSIIKEIALELVKADCNVKIQNSAMGGINVEHNNIQNIGFVKDLSVEIESCDCVILPYDSNQYRTKGSGILWDALAAGVPIIAPFNTAPGRWLNHSKSGVLYTEHNIASILSAFNKIKINYEYYAKNAYLYKNNWLLTQGVRNFIKKILI